MIRGLTLKAIERVLEFRVTVSQRHRATGVCRPATTRHQAGH